MDSTYRHILGFYNNSKALRIGTLLTFPDNDVITFTKNYLNENILVIVNCRNKAVTYSLPGLLANTYWTNALDNSSMTLGTTLFLQPYQFIIAKK